MSKMQTLKIALLGDAAFYGKFSLENKEIFDNLKETSNFLKTHDYVVLNLETPFANDLFNTFGNKSAYLKSEPKTIEILKYLNVNAVTLANNHIFDFGVASFELTKKTLEENNIQFFGVEGKELRINMFNNKIAFSGYCCYSTNPLNLNSKGVNPLNYAQVKKSMLLNKENGYNNIVSVHAGQEHVNYPNYDHILLARKLSDVCPYVYYGHHPHVLQGFEKINDSIISYSLGNFCFDDVYTDKSQDPLVKMTDNNKSSAILTLEFNNNKLQDYKITPIFDGNLCNEEKKLAIYDKINIYSEKLKCDKTSYIEEREALLNDYIQGRKSKRDIKWYIKRLNYNSFRMIVNAYTNHKKYIANLKKYL